MSSTPTRPASHRDTAPTARPPPARHERRHVVVDVVGEQEVEHEADGGAEAPEDADEADARAADDVEDEEQAGECERHPGEREPARGLRWRSQSQPTMRTGARYSSSSATPTERCVTALK